VEENETTNLAAAHPEVVARLRAELDAWWKPSSRGRIPTTV
jgi:hypothetical protein